MTCWKLYLPRGAYYFLSLGRLRAVVREKLFRPSVPWDTCDCDLPHANAAEMAPVYPKGRKITAKHADLWVCCGVLGGLRRKLRFEFARHRDGDLLSG